MFKNKLINFHKRSRKKSRKSKKSLSTSLNNLTPQKSPPKKPKVIKQTPKVKRFTRTLKACKKALNDAKIPFHLHSGSALGAIREGSFIEHDNDIDIAVFANDYKRTLVTAMKKNGFEVSSTYGTLDFGKEYTFCHEKTKVCVDVFIVYSEIDRKNSKDFSGERFYWIASYLGCYDHKYKRCRWKYRPYVPVPIKINGLDVMTAPVSMVEDGYGPDWSTPKKFDYFEGLEKKHYTNLIDE